MTIIPGAAGGNVHSNIEFKVLKNIKDAVTTYGLHSPFTRGILDSLVTANTVMLLYDWKMLFSMLMTPAQYVVWQSEYENGVEAEIRRGLPAGVTVDHLMGKGQSSTLAQQQNSPRRSFAIIHMCAMNALKRVDDSDSQSTQAFLKIMQGPDEPYASFISRLQTALDRQIDNSVAKQELLIKLAFSNANHDCQKILQPVANKPGVTLAEFLQLCRIVGTTTHKMDMLATAITASLPNSNSASTSPPDAFAVTRNGNCFNCGKPGHFKNQCRMPGGGAVLRGQTRGPSSSSKPKTICPRCRKGYHWASQCRSNPSLSQPSGN